MSSNTFILIIFAPFACTMLFWKRSINVVSKTTILTHLTWRGFVRQNNSIACEKAAATSVAANPIPPKTKKSIAKF